MEPTKKEKVFAAGAIFKRKNENAPDFVKGHISIKVDEFTAFIAKHNNKGWVNLDLKESQGKKLYLELNEWKPKDKTTEDINPNDIPFN